MKTTTTKTHPIKLSIRLALASFTALLFGACASTTNTQTGPPSATARIQQSSAAYYGSTSAGVGVLNYHGQQHRFTMSSIGAGGIGAQNMAGYAKVYHLTNLADFPGTYKGISSGLTLIAGTMHAKLANDKGVIIYLAAATEGVASSMGMQVYEVKLNTATTGPAHQ